MFSLEGNRILWNGEEVGRHERVNGKSKVTVLLTYETTGEWVVPISWLSYGLKTLPEYAETQRPISVLQVTTADEDVEDLEGVLRRLDEKTIRGNGYVWQFHKSDADHWPSAFHAHDYEKGLKLDVLTGQIWDGTTRTHVSNLKSKALEELRDDLQQSKDFKDRIQLYFPIAGQP